MAGVEENSVTLADLKSGVQLRAGHEVLLIVSDGHGSTLLKSAGGWDEDEAAAESAAETGESDAEEAGPAPGTVGGVEGGAYVIEVQLHAAGGTPLAHERVRIHDPDTGEEVGEPGVTDENGVLKARVPADKEYAIHIDADAPEEYPDAFSDHEHPLAAHLPYPDEHAVLHVALLDAQGDPLKSETVQVKDEAGTAQELKTDDRGTIELQVEHGLFTLQVRGKELVAHSVLSGELSGEDAPYRFVVPS